MINGVAVGPFLTFLTSAFTTAVVALWAFPQVWNAFKHRREGRQLRQQYRIREAIGALGWFTLLLFNSWEWGLVVIGGPIARRPFGEDWFGALIALVVINIFALWYLYIYRAIKRRGAA